MEQLDPVIEGDVAEEIDKLKRQPGKDILVFGSGNLVNALMRHNLPTSRRERKQTDRRNTGRAPASATILGRRIRAREPRDGGEKGNR